MPAMAQSTPANSQATAPAGFDLGRFLFDMQRRVNRSLNDRLAAIERGEDSAALWGGIAIAFLYGVFHALGPGHGKTVVFGYFLGRSARIWRGIGMSFWLAGTHIAAALLLVLGAKLFLAPIAATAFEDLRWLRGLSYAAILAIGSFMLWRAWRHGDNEHCHAHHGDHSRHAVVAPSDRRGEQRILALAAGFIPCSGAILILAFTLGHGLFAAGLAMVGAIALGMGGTLSLLGVASIALRGRLVRHFGRAGGLMGRFGRILSLVSAGSIAAIGAVLLLGQILID